MYRVGKIRKHVHKINNLLFVADDIAVTNLTLTHQSLVILISWKSPEIS